MSKGRANESSERGEEGERSTVSEPGGGPRRVVSEKSVDDILASLGDGPESDSGEGGGTGDEPAESSETRRTEGTAEATDPEERASVSPTDAEPELDEDDPEAETTTEGDSAGTELSYEDDDALAGRVAANDVTGADVRAAETDPDRESTPGIDDVDLSLDDLEDGQPGGAAAKSESAGNSSDDGSSTDGSADDAATDDESDDGSPSLFRRLLPW